MKAREPDLAHGSDLNTCLDEQERPARDRVEALWAR
jgi:hypothetical protein